MVRSHAAARRDGVVAGGTERVAARDASGCKPHAAHGTVCLQGLHGVGAATWAEATGRRQQRPQDQLIEAHQHISPARQGSPGGLHGTPSLARPRRKSSISRAKGACPRGVATDEHQVGAGRRTSPQQQPRGFPQAPPGAVAHHGVADLLGDRKAQPGRRIVVAQQGLQDQAGRGCLAPPGGHAQELRPAPEMRRAGPANGHRRYAESFFRPLARRLAITLRPPTVSMRARKPCRRLRTSLDG